MFILHSLPRPMLLDVLELSSRIENLPAFTVKDVAFLTAMGISLDLSRDFRTQS